MSDWWDDSACRELASGAKQWLDDPDLQAGDLGMTLVEIQERYLGVMERAREIVARSHPERLAEFDEKIARLKDARARQADRPEDY